MKVFLDRHARHLAYADLKPGEELNEEREERIRKRAAELGARTVEVYTEAGRLVRTIQLEAA